MSDKANQVVADDLNPHYDPFEDAVDAIAEHLACDDSAYAEQDEAERQAQRIVAAIKRRGLEITPKKRAAMETDKLLPCPFCGSEDLRAHVNMVDCRSCGACGPESDALSSGSIRSDTDAFIWKSKAIAAWNARAKPRGGE